MKFWNSIKLSAVSLVAVIIPSAAFAAPTYSGLTTIQSVVAFQSGIVVFTIGSAPSSPWSSCNVNHQFAINTASISGQAIYNNIITAEQQAKGVYIVGLGTCVLKGGIEDVDFVQINP